MEKKAQNLEAQVIKLPWSSYYGLVILHSASNCKLTSIDYIRELFSGSATEEQRIAGFKEVLKDCRMLVYINTNNDIIADFLTKNFEIYGHNKVPVGYGGGYQHHIFIRNTYSKHGTAYLRDVEKPTQAVATPNKEMIKQVITSTLKSKRRKLDVVEDIMKQI